MCNFAFAKTSKTPHRLKQQSTYNYEIKDNNMV